MLWSLTALSVTVRLKSQKRYCTAGQKMRLMWKRVVSSIALLFTNILQVHCQQTGHVSLVSITLSRLKCFLVSKHICPDESGSKTYIQDHHYVAPIMEILSKTSITWQYCLARWGHNPNLGQSHLRLRTCTFLVLSLKQVGSEGPLLSVARSPRVGTCHLILIGEEGAEALAGWAQIQNLSWVRILIAKEGATNALLAG